MTVSTDIRIMVRLTSSFAKIIMKPLSATRILKEFRVCLLKEQQKKGMELTHQGIKIDIPYRGKLGAENAELHLRDGAIISQVETTLPGHVEST